MSYLEGDWKLFQDKVEVIEQIEKKLSKNQPFLRNIFDITETLNKKINSGFLKSKVNGLLAFLQKILLRRFFKSS